MLYVHPALQIVAALLTLYVLYLGAVRFASAHMGQRLRFDWKRHVLFGKVVCVLWLAGMAGGMYMTSGTWRRVGITGEHFDNAMGMLPFICAAFVTGWYMDRYKARRRYLPLVHTANNIVLLYLLVLQMRSGLAVVRDFLLS